MKDGYAYNVQWRGAQPTFIDVPSFERSTGGPWVGYRQFCQTFLFPLLIQAHKDISFRPLLRGAIDGIDPQQARAMLGGPGSALRKGVLKHVVLHSAMDTKMSSNKQGTEAFKKELSESGFSSDLTKATVKAIRKLVEGLSYKAADSHWETYQKTSTYTDDERAVKAAFVDSSLEAWAAGTGTGKLGMVWDMGCNDGTYSRLALKHAESVVAVDGDEQTIDSLYRALKQERNKKILPLVMNLTDPSPGIGWRGTERLPFETRRKPDAILCLALVHHLALTANVPLPQILDWYAVLRLPPGHRVGRPDRPDGQAAALAQAGGHLPGLPAGGLRAAARGALRDRPPRGAGVGHPHPVRRDPPCLTRRPAQTDSVEATERHRRRTRT